MVTARGVHTLAPLTGLMLALIDVHLTGRPIPTLHRIETKHSYHKLYMKKTRDTGPALTTQLSLQLKSLQEKCKNLRSNP